MKSFARLQNVDPGFNPKNVLTMELALPQLKYPKGKPVIDFYAEVERRVARIPGVQHVALTSILPLSGTNSDSSFHIEGRNEMQTGVFPDEEIRVIRPDYFQVLQTRLLAGRFLTDADTADAPGVVVINQAMAKKYWPGENAIGKRINFDDHDPANIKWVTVVGVVGDIRHRGLDQDAKPEYYVPHPQLPYRQMILAIRSAQDSRSLVSAVRREMQAFDPEQPLANIKPLEQITSESIAPRRLSVVLLGVFAAVALVLASVGIYGVMSFLVVQRTHEIGVRMALGAQRNDVLLLVIGRAAKLVIIGSALGLVLAAISSRALGALLYNVRAFDLTTFFSVTLALGGVALLASYIPALRATRADPMLALAHNA
ncbi:MAG: ABC transporter permease [Verrucomicrobiota bacterium]|nr:ABC transporter permease [Verrucomicrobiota bacterium]